MQTEPILRYAQDDTVLAHGRAKSKLRLLPMGYINEGIALIAECFLAIPAKGVASLPVRSVIANSEAIVGTQRRVAFLAARQSHAPVLIVAHGRTSACKKDSASLPQVNCGGKRALKMNFG